MADFGEEGWGYDQFDARPVGTIFSLCSVTSYFYVFSVTGALLPSEHFSILSIVSGERDGRELRNKLCVSPVGVGGRRKRQKELIEKVEVSIGEFSRYAGTASGRGIVLPFIDRREKIKHSSGGKREGER